MKIVFLILIILILILTIYNIKLNKKIKFLKNEKIKLENNKRRRNNGQ